MRKLLGVLLFALVLSSCGDGGDAVAEPLLFSTLTGSYDGTSITPINGFATVYEGSPLIVVGEGPVHCGSESASNPPSGYNAAITLPDFVVGNYGTVFVRMFKTAGGFEGIGASLGTVNITEVTADSISGDIAFSYTDDEARQFELNGEFEVFLCAP